ncbi:MAG: hypothetical protein II281_01575, partial [Alistipes sp.]|nr:hypothetical protein [Alistipes sp.]
MKRLLIQMLLVVAVLLCAACDRIVSPDGTTLTGVVKCDGEAISGVAVTDGEQIVYTNERGEYNIASTKPYGLVYITTPSGYKPAMKDSVRPNFWAKTVEAIDVNERHDFELKKVDDSTFSVLMISDTHFCNDPKRNDVKHFKELVMPAINRAATDTPHSIFSVNLGDITWDRFWYA